MIQRHTRPKARRSGPPRRGRIVDKRFLAWLHTLPDAVDGSTVDITAHHIRRHGGPKSDRRAIPLSAKNHLYDSGEFSIERIGKEKFEARWGVILEDLILYYNGLYGQEQGAREP